tara:strand:- start:637 stop:789 length:153 start_codon:yes stop_codon:yes gene_type:complete
MSKLEELLYSAEEHGQRYKMFEEIKNQKEQHPNLSLEEIYEKAYQIVMKI